MYYITETLNWISISLLLPVIVLLLAALGASLIELGGFFSAYLVLLCERRHCRNTLETLRAAGRVDLFQLGRGPCSRHLGELSRLGWDEIHCDKAIADWQAGYARDLERSSFMMKVGPILGLMGTLIPMGPALGALASGDVGSMAYNMQVAFATTVAGCFVAGVGLMVHSVKKHWYADEIASLQYALDLELRHCGGECETDAEGRRHAAA
ncbi:hypothetical protein SDC9_123071 [bioreactor metagenome]|uniref:MotA/TolQ/ExbB proton channel domain-containing protein n=1 Tax=bioreactor metagenome TaxID=1076179 RepID=A0A645CGI7_9ZZZZ